MNQSIDYQGHLLAGVDEAGRGPLAGPVIAAAVILDPSHPIEGLCDSKKISEKKRQRLASEIKHKALCFALGRAEVFEIDQLNILQASLLAMQRAIEGLTIRPEYAIVDGNQCPRLSIPCQAIVKGDASEASISAASIIAKVERDHEMLNLARDYPNYGFEKHKGYPTKLHMQALDTYGASPLHRRSFAPVRQRILETG